MRFLTIPLLAVVLAACQVGPQDTRPVPSVRQIGSDLKCPKGDHGYEDPAGWGFCYPGTWEYILKSQSTSTPIQELDIVFDVTDLPCGTPAGTSPAPVCASPVTFGVIIVSTFARNNAPDLAAWIQANLNPAPAFQPIDWGDALEAGQFTDGRRIALTPQQVVILALHPGNLDLEGAMSRRLSTWKFSV
jgi:hypothetical protein